MFGSSWDLYFSGLVPVNVLITFEMELIPQFSTYGWMHLIHEMDAFDS